MDRWFPANPTVSFSSTTGAEAAQPRPCRARIICFHGAGSDPTTFTSRGTAKRPMPNPLLTYCVDNDVQLLTVHLPGRTSRIQEKFMTTAVAVAATLLEYLEPLLTRPKTPNGNNFELSDETPLVLVGHSMGTFIAYEFACLMRQRGLPPPRHLFLSCMVSPDFPKEKRPWCCADSADSEGLKQECKEWGVNKEIFAVDLWEMYEPILRADFKIIDDYSFIADGKLSDARKSVSSSTSTSPASSPGARTASYHAPLGISTTVFYADQDARIKKEHVEGWKKVLMGWPLFSSSPSGFGTLSNSDAEFNVKRIPGNHNFFYDPDARICWMEALIQVIDKLLIDMEYGS